MVTPRDPLTLLVHGRSTVHIPFDMCIIYQCREVDKVYFYHRDMLRVKCKDKARETLCAYAGHCLSNSLLMMVPDRLILGHKLIWDTLHIAKKSGESGARFIHILCDENFTPSLRHGLFVHELHLIIWCGICNSVLMFAETWMLHYDVRKWLSSSPHPISYPVCFYYTCIFVGNL